MIGLIVLMVIGVYVAAFYLVVRATVRWARNNGRSTKRWGWIAALAMYLPVFWDHIPTVLLHQYLCATEQGFWVYKTVEEWQQENPGVAETLNSFNKLNKFKEPGIQAGYMLNQRCARVVREKKKPLPFLPVSVYEEHIVDRANKEILAKQIRIGSGYGGLALGGKGSWKFWMSQPDCNRTRKEFSEYMNQVKRQGDRQ
jgi:hypothetical protein